MIKRVRLRNFRSHEDIELTFDDGVNAIVGPNGVGKTNILEAIYFTSLGRSFRAKLPELVQRDKDWAKTEIDTSSQKIHSLIDDRGEKPTKQLTIDGQKKRFSKHQLPVVLFEPEQLRMFTAGPELRRSYIDEVIGSTSNVYTDNLKRHQRLISQRNRLLKHPNPDQSTLFVIDLKLSEYGATIDKMRRELVEKLNTRASDIYSHIAPKSSLVDFSYSSSVGSSGDYATNYLKTAEKNRQRDTLLGYTSSGIHRDDLTASINDKDVMQTASRGETRTLAITAKLIELSLLEEALGEKPILLLDDVLSELDTERQNRLLKIIGRAQTIIAATNAERGLDNIKRL